MIGQKVLKERLHKIIENGNYPRFSIITGQKGSGKKLIVDYIFEELNSYSNVYKINVGTGVEDIRDMITQAYKNTMPTVYTILDADKMSLNAKNAMLKVIEEPPNNAYFIMTLEDENNTLETIKSRATIYKMKLYKPAEIKEYFMSLDDTPFTNDDEINIVQNLCETPGEVDTLVKYGVLGFVDYVNTVIDNIAVTSGANSFKISEKINLKDDDSKYDLRLFWKSFRNECLRRIRENMLYYAQGVQITSRYLHNAEIKGVNKQAVFDGWILDIREVWR